MKEFKVDALYYPHMRLDNSAWIRSQLLYFDKIRTISPFNVDIEPIGRDESELIDNHLVVRQSPILMSSAVERASRFAAMLLTMSRSVMVGSHLSNNSIYTNASKDALDNLRNLINPDIDASIRNVVPHIHDLEEQLREVLSDRYVRIHPDKLQWKLEEFLRGSNVAEDNNDVSSWVNVHPLFASIYMTVLAREISVDERISCITDESVHDALFQDVVATKYFNQTHRNRCAEGVLADVIMSAIKIDPETKISRIIDFKNRHKDELNRFRSLIYSLAPRCSNMENYNEMRSEAQLIFEREIGPSVEDLERALSGFGILWTRSGIIKAASVIISAVGGLAAFDYTGNNYIALSATLGVGVSGFALSGWGERQSAIESSPHAYLLDLAREFGP